MGKEWQILFWGAPKSLQMVIAAMKLRRLFLGRKAMTTRQHIQKQRHYFANKGPSSQGYGFSSSHIWMWEFDHKESWAPKNWCFWTVVLENTLESPLDCKEIQPVHSKGNQSWISIGRTDAEAEIQFLWPPDANNWVTGKDPDARKDWRQKEKWATEDEMVGWHHQLDGHVFEQTPRAGDRQGSLVCSSPWRCKFRHDWTTELTALWWMKIRSFHKEASWWKGLAVGKTRPCSVSHSPPQYSFSLYIFKIIIIIILLCNIVLVLPYINMQRGRGEWFGRMPLKHVKYHIRNESPIQVQCRIQEACGCIS